MVFEIIQNNFVAVAIISFLILFISTNNNFDRKTNRFFFAAAFCVLILIVAETWEAQLASNPTFAPARIVLSAIGYSLRPMVPYFLVIMVNRYSRMQLALLSLPLAINVLTSFSALFCSWAFSYTPENEFVRGPLGLTPFLVAGFYVVVLLIVTIREFQNESALEALIVSAIVLLAFLATLLESIFGFRFIQNPSIAISITFYYLFLHSNRNNRDVLTGVLTRRRFYIDAQKYASTLSAVISLDLNDLKMLNDKYGHMEGDRALLVLTKIIKKHMRTQTSLYRTGGDEFMILCYKLDEKSVQEIISRIRNDLKATSYRCAIGYALHSSQTDFDGVCQGADRMMYENKRQMKKQNSY